MSMTEKEFVQHIEDLARAGKLEELSEFLTQWLIDKEKQWKDKPR